jgi:hypothetical protein
MPSELHVTDITRVIQLAVAPVFLLSALGTILGVLSMRLGRIVDRSRALAERLAGTEKAAQPRLQEELALLLRRRHLVNLAITSAVVAALLVCLLIAFAFLGFILRSDFARSLAGLFIAAMVAFVATLLLFLREVLLAVGGLRAGR